MPKYTETADLRIPAGQAPSTAELRQFIIDNGYTVLSITTTKAFSEVFLNPSLTDPERIELANEFNATFGRAQHGRGRTGETDPEARVRYKDVIDQCTLLRFQVETFEFPTTGPPTGRKDYGISLSEQQAWQARFATKDTASYPFDVFTFGNEEAVEMTSATDVEDRYNEMIDLVADINKQADTRKKVVDQAGTLTAARNQAEIYLNANGNCSKLEEALGP